MTTLNEYPRKKLQEIIKEFGCSICKEPKRVKALLRDLCPEHKREVNLLVTALEERVVEELLNINASIPFELTLKRLSQRLHDNLGTVEDFAEWSVQSWALSLNIIQQPMPKTTIVNKPASQTTSHSKPAISNIATSSDNKQIGKFIVQDGIAKDTTTGLMWLRFAHGQTWKNNSAFGDQKAVTWKVAFDVAQQFNQQGGYASFTDWRLPTIDELKTLIDYTKGKSGDYIDTDVFPNNTRKRNNRKLTTYWSSSPTVDTSWRAWYVNFNYGYDNGQSKDYYVHVRLVRDSK